MLPFVKSIKQQLFRCVPNLCTCILAPKNALIPFCFEDIEVLSFQVSIKDTQDNLIQVIPSSYFKTDCKRLEYDGSIIDDLELDCEKQYYLCVQINRVNYYSEAFCPKFLINDECQTYITASCPMPKCEKSELINTPYQLKCEQDDDGSIILTIDYTNYFTSIGSTNPLNFNVTSSPSQSWTYPTTLSATANVSAIDFNNAIEINSSFQFDYVCNDITYQYTVVSTLNTQGLILPPLGQSATKDFSIGDLTTTSDCILLNANDISQYPIINSAWLIDDQPFSNNSQQIKLDLSNYTSPLRIERVIETPFSVCNIEYDLEFETPNPCLQHTFIQL